MARLRVVEAPPPTGAEVLARAAGQGTGVGALPWAARVRANLSRPLVAQRARIHPALALAVQWGRAQMAAWRRERVAYVALALAVVGCAGEALHWRRSDSPADPAPETFLARAFNPEPVEPAEPFPSLYGPETDDETFTTNGARQKRAVPDKPFADQMAAPCPNDPAIATINGGCWLGPTPCSPTLTYESRDGKCYVPMPARKHKPRSETLR